MKYYRLIFAFNEADDGNYVSCNAGQLHGLSEYSTMEGKPLKTNWTPVTLPYNTKEGNVFSDYLHNVYGWLLVSDRFIRCVQPFDEDSVEYLDVTILNSHSGKGRTDYKVANVIDVVDALDLANSVYDTYVAAGKEFIVVRKFSLKFSVVQNHHIFKLSNESAPVFVSEEIKNIIEKHSMTGFDFVPVQLS